MNKETMSYWEKRKAQRMFEHMQSAEETAKQIAKAYFKSSQFLLREKEIIFDRYKKKHHLDDMEARQLLNQMHDTSSITELKALLRQTKGEDKKELLKQLESPAYASRIKKLEEKQKEVDMLAEKMYGLEKSQSTKHYKKLIKDTYYKSIYDIQKDTGLAFSFSKIPAKEVDKVLKSKWSGVNYSSRIWKNTQGLAKSVKEELLVNIMTGRNEEDSVRAIQEKFAVSAAQARRLVRTESCYIVNEMEAQSYEECGIEQYMYVATLDKRTSEECRKHDGKVYDVSKRSAGVNFPPLHPWCRSTTIAYLGDDILSDMERRARNDDTGETYTVPATTSYQEWFDGLVEKDGMLRFDLDLQLFGNKASVNYYRKIKEKVILSQEEVIEQAKEFAKQLEVNPELLVYDNGWVYSNYINQKLGYDEKPTVVAKERFSEISKGKNILYRGIKGIDDKSANEMVEQFKNGKFYCGRGVYGNGTYTAIDKSVAELYAFGSKTTKNGKIMEMVLSADAKTVDFREIYLEWEEIDGSKKVWSKKEEYQKVISDVGSYAAMKGYDAILLNGYQNKYYVIILNRGKVIVKE